MYKVAQHLTLRATLFDAYTFMVADLWILTATNSVTSTTSRSTSRLVLLIGLRLHLLIGNICLLYTSDAADE